MFRSRVKPCVRCLLAVCVLFAGNALAATAAAPAPSAPASSAELRDAAPALDPKVLALATRAMACAAKRGERMPVRTLSVIDYSLPSTQPRLWIFDVQRQRLLFEERVAHGRNSGENLSTRFSNALGSHMSSLGAYITEDAYVGINGYSLRLRGLEPGVNDNARERAIVIHGAPYVREELAKKQGRIGRSLGCPAVRTEVAKPLIDAIRGGSFVFAYYPDADWLASSPLLQASCGD